MNMVNAVIQMSAMKHPNQWAEGEMRGYERINDTLSLLKSH